MNTKTPYIVLALAVILSGEGCGPQKTPENASEDAKPTEASKTSEVNKKADASPSVEVSTVSYVSESSPNAPLICPVYYTIDEYGHRLAKMENGVVCSDGKVYCTGPNQRPIPMPEDREGYICTHNQYGILDYIQTEGFESITKGFGEYLEDGDSWDETHNVIYPYCADQYMQFGMIHPQPPEFMRVWDCQGSAQDEFCLCGGKPCDGACILETCIERSHRIEVKCDSWYDEDCPDDDVKNGYNDEEDEEDGDSEGLPSSADVPREIRYGADYERYAFDADVDDRLYCAGLEDCFDGDCYYTRKATPNDNGNPPKETSGNEVDSEKTDGDALCDGHTEAMMAAIARDKNPHNPVPAVLEKYEVNYRLEDCQWNHLKPTLQCGKNWILGDSGVHCLPNPSGEDITVFEECPNMPKDLQKTWGNRSLDRILRGIPHNLQPYFLELVRRDAYIQETLARMNYIFLNCKQNAENHEELFDSCARRLPIPREDWETLQKLPPKEQIEFARTFVQKETERIEGERKVLWNRMHSLSKGTKVKPEPWIASRDYPHWDPRLQNCLCGNEFCAPGTGCIDGHCVDIATHRRLPKEFVWNHGRPYCADGSCTCGTETCHGGEWCIVDRCFDSPYVMRIDIDIPGVLTIRDKYVQYGMYRYTGHRSSFWDEKKDEPIPRNEYLPLTKPAWFDIMLHRYAAMCNEPDMPENISDYRCIVTLVDNACFEAPIEVYSYRGYHCIRDEGCACGESTCPKHGRCYHGTCILDDVYVAMACAADFFIWGHGGVVKTDANGWCLCGSSKMPPNVPGYECGGADAEYGHYDFNIGMECGLHAGCACGDTTCPHGDYCLEPGTCVDLEELRRRTEEKEKTQS